ncbi:hypothetical protein FEF22_001995, partial [Texas Phoenix palm phytoplasma]
MNEINYELNSKRNKLSLENIQKKFKINKNNNIENIFPKKWKEIDKNLQINLPNFEKEKLLNIIQKKTKQELFYDNLNLDEIIETIKEDIENYVQTFFHDLNKKIYDIVYNYIFLEKNLDQIEPQQIDLITKKAFLMT